MQRKKLLTEADQIFLTEAHKKYLTVPYKKHLTEACKKHLDISTWCKSRSSIAVATASSDIISAHFGKGLFEVRIIEPVS